MLNPGPKLTMVARKGLTKFATFAPDHAYFLLYGAPSACAGQATFGVENKSRDKAQKDKAVYHQVMQQISINRVTFFFNLCRKAFLCLNVSFFLLGANEKECVTWDINSSKPTADVQLGARLPSTHGLRVSNSNAQSKSCFLHPHCSQNSQALHV
eukprot:scaffold203113_cov14-Tisochrysis_lutea.AAC.1